MSIKVSEYLETQTEFNNNDLFDVSAYLGVDSYESRKTLFSTLKEKIFPALSNVFTKDANDNVFYNGVSPTLGTSCSKNIFHKTGGAITLGNGAIGNIFEPTENTTNFVFGANLRNVTIKAGNYPAHPTAGTLTLTSGSYTFLYNKDYPAQIFVGANAAAYHSYYDGANNRYVITNLVTLVVSYIGAGGVPYTGATADVDLGIHSLTADTIGIGTTAGAEKLHIDGGASTTRVKIDADNGVSRILSFRTDDVQRWALRVDGVESGSNSGADFQLRRYNDGGTFIDHPISINRATGNITTSQNLNGATATEMGYLSGVTSAIQTQIDTARRGTILFAPSTINPVDNTTYYFSTGLFYLTTQTDADINLGYAFKVIGAVISVSNNAGTAGSNEDSTLSLRNTLAGTSTTIGTFKTSVASNAQYEKTITGLSISVAATDTFALQWAFPAAATNPTAIFLRITLIVEFT